MSGTSRCEIYLNDGGLFFTSSPPENLVYLSSTVTPNILDNPKAKGSTKSVKNKVTSYFASDDKRFVVAMYPTTILVNKKVILKIHNAHKGVDCCN